MAESIHCVAGAFSASSPVSIHRRHRGLAALPSRSAALFSRMRRRLRASSDTWEGMIKLEDEEASTLIDMCRDLDWESCVDALRREAMRMNDAARKDAIKLPRPGAKGNGEEWDYREAVLDLRRRASLQAAEDVAKQLNCSDYAQTVSSLAQDILNGCQQLVQDETSGGGGNGSTSPLAAPSFLLATLAGLHGLISSLAVADELQSQVEQAQDKVPSWLPPAVLGFPVASYLVFNLYRDQVNPQARLADFLFAVAALFIVGNIITSATLGVRLY